MASNVEHRIIILLAMISVLAFLYSSLSAYEGLSLGGSIIVKDFDKELEEKPMGMRFDANYERKIMDNSLEFEIELGLIQYHVEYEENKMEIDVYAQYNKNVSDVSQLSILLNNVTLLPFSNKTEYNSVLSPGFKLIQKSDLTDFYLQIDFPFYLFDGYNPGYKTFDKIFLSMICLVWRGLIVLRDMKFIYCFFYPSVNEKVVLVYQ